MKTALIIVFLTVVWFSFESSLGNTTENPNVWTAHYSYSDATKVAESLR